jgi:hypothetical protein
MLPSHCTAVTLVRIREESIPARAANALSRNLEVSTNQIQRMITVWRGELPGIIVPLASQQISGG